MTAPTAPTAPLPSLLPCPFCGEDHRLTPRVGCVECYMCGGSGPEPSERNREAVMEAWNRRSDAALLAMQRERDRWKSRATIAAGIIETATEQLAASERTCAELRGIKETATKLADDYLKLCTQLAGEKELREAAERTVEGWKSLCRDMLGALKSAGCYGEHWAVMNRATQMVNTTELARLEGEGT
jgi:hypothetical protein